MKPIQQDNIYVRTKSKYKGAYHFPNTEGDLSRGKCSINFRLANPLDIALFNAGNTSIYKDINDNRVRCREIARKRHNYLGL